MVLTVDGAHSCDFLVLFVHAVTRRVGRNIEIYDCEVTITVSLCRQWLASRGCAAPLKEHHGYQWYAPHTQHQMLVVCTGVRRFTAQWPVT